MARVGWRAGIPLGLTLVVLLTAGFTVYRWRRGPDVELALSWKAGEIIRHRLEMEMEATIQAPLVGEQELALDLSATGVQKVLDVDEDGNATIEMRVVRPRLTSTLGAPPPEQLEGLRVPQGMVVSPDGRVLESSNPFLGPQPTTGQGFLLYPFLPDHPVGPGDTWETRYEQGLPFGDVDGELTARSEFLRYDEVGDIEAVMIRTETEGPFEFTVRPEDVPADALGTRGADLSEVPPGTELRYAGELDAETTTWVDPDTSTVLRSDGGGDVGISFSFGTAGFPIPAVAMDIHIDLETVRL